MTVILEIAILKIQHAICVSYTVSKKCWPTFQTFNLLTLECHFPLHILMLINIPALFKNLFQRSNLFNCIGRLNVSLIFQMTMIKPTCINTRIYPALNVRSE